MASELQQLLETLEGLRASVLRKLAGLGADDAGRSTVPSGTHVAGLVQHLTFVESMWFEEIVAGRKATRGHRSMLVDPSTSLRDLGDLGWALLQVIQETARHVGHADILCEQIDGQTGR